MVIESAKQVDYLRSVGAIPDISDISESFQERVNDWMQHCFGPKVTVDKNERNLRFLEEALELVQAAGCQSSSAHQLVDYVFNRPAGEVNQEVGGVSVTFAALCNAHDIDQQTQAEIELDRIWKAKDQIRIKHASKPKL